MYMAIITKYLGPTKSTPARVKASCEIGQVTRPWGHGKDDQANHAAVAEELARDLRWEGNWHGGRLPDGGCAFVRVIPDFSGRGFDAPAFEITRRDREG